MAPLALRDTIRGGHAALGLAVALEFRIMPAAAALLHHVGEFSDTGLQARGYRKRIQHVEDDHRPVRKFPGAISLERDAVRIDIVHPPEARERRALRADITAPHMRPFPEPVGIRDFDTVMRRCDT